MCITNSQSAQIAFHCIMFYVSIAMNIRSAQLHITTFATHVHVFATDVIHAVELARVPGPTAMAIELPRLKILA